LISHSISLVSKHLKAANASVKKIEESLKELEALVKTQKGYAKKELSKVIKKKTTHLTELKAHVAEGNQVLVDSEKKLKELKSKDAKKEEDIDKKLIQKAITKNNQAWQTKYDLAEKTNE